MIFVEILFKQFSSFVFTIRIIVCPDVYLRYFSSNNRYPHFGLCLYETSTHQPYLNLHLLVCFFASNVLPVYNLSQIGNYSSAIYSNISHELAPNKNCISTLLSCIQLRTTRTIICQRIPLYGHSFEACLQAAMVVYFELHSISFIYRNLVLAIAHLGFCSFRWMHND